ncbi:MAG: DUF5050 domain-containing protein [Clostridia bacterium]|nr:DUF5050 domain-containing protein [Clostridia bacterium]
MKKIKLVIVTLLALLLCVSVFCACDKSDGDSQNSGNESQPSGEVTPSGNEKPKEEIVLKDITGITFSDLTVTYDGNSHSVEIAGNLPQGVSVKYQDAQKTDAGSYNATATLSGDGYNSLVLNAKLVIEKAQFEGITFPSIKEEYNGLAHAVEVVGQRPENTTVTYSCKEDPNVSNAPVETGTYTIVATLTNPNYNMFNIETTVEVTASENERHIVYADGKLYFANALDSDKLYYYTAQDGVTKISSDVPYNFAVTSNNEVFFRSHTLFASSIKKIVDGEVSNVEFKNAEYLCTDGTNLYYAVNGLTSKSSGIYKIAINNSTQTIGDPQLISSGKAKYLQIYNGYIYFADCDNGYKLSRIGVNGGTRNMVVDEKIAALTAGNGYLFFTVDNLLGNYLANYNISTATKRKLSVDAGSNLTLIGNELYYLNVDLITSAIRGKGIYKVDAFPTSDKNSMGVKVVGADGEKYTSLTKLNDRTIAYYKVSTQMLCLYDLVSQQVNEILDGFTAPETTPITTGSKIATYGNYIYFMDIYNDKSLYSYNTVSGSFSRITAGKVIDFSILGDTLYFNTESKGIKNYLYKLDMKGGIPQLVCERDCVDIVQGGDKIFYVEKNSANARTAIHEINAQGVDTMIYSKGAEFLTYYDGYIYFVDGRDLLKMPINGYTYNAPITVKKGNVDTFVISNGVVYFREQYGVGYLNKRLSRVNVDGSGYAVIVSKGTDPLEIVVDSDTIYYYNDVTSDSSSGIYSISANARENQNPTLILGRSSTYYASELTLFKGKLYFINYYNYLGDSHLYRIDLTGNNLVKIA